MYLKTLELQGFKSFADKTSIDLQKGISGIVGPNGSGKSNIVEAIKWVLGEQKVKNLRSHKMEDVIFNGTKKRKPLGMAEVSLILDNSDYGLALDYTEIKVTRRLYRSGDGEYLINGKNCRLKDIQQLFADTGIGNDGYSVIGQGRISQIVEAKPEERRSMVEETAGIVKYRERKKEALRKITAADDNLLRLQDIMTEIEDRLEPLKQDSYNAQKYLQYKDEEDKLSIGILAETAVETQDKLNKIEADILKVDKDFQGVTAGIIQRESALAEKKADLLELEDVYGDEQQHYHSLSHAIQEAEGEIKAQESRILGYDEKIKMLQEEIGAGSEKLTAAQAKAVEEKENHSQLTEKVKTLAEQLEEVKNKRLSEEEGITKVELAIEDLKNQAFEIGRQRSQKKNKITSLEQALTSYTRRLTSIEDKRRGYDEDEEILDSRIEEINRFLDDLLAKENEINAKKQDYRNNLGQEKTNIAAKREAIMSLKMEKSRSEARLKVLEELILKREGFYPGVKAVLDEKSRGGFSGIIGVVAELLKVDKAYTVAVEAVLGSSLQNLVAKTGEDAAAAVNFLKKQRRGIATFLPLDMLRIRDRQVPPREITANSDYLGVAADFVTVPRDIQSIAEYLLGNTLIFKTLDAAVSVARKVKGSYRFVSLDGDIINSSGAVSGGSREAKKNSFLQRQSEMEELRRRTLSIAREEEQLNADILAIAEQREHIKSQLDALDKQREGLALEKTSYDGEIKKIDTRREIYLRERQGLDLESEGILREQSEAEQEIASLNKELEQSELEEKELLASIDTKEAELKNAKVSDDAGRDQYTELRIAHTEQKALLDNSIANLQRLNQEVDLLKTQVQDSHKELESTQAVKDQSVNAVEKAGAEVMAKNKELAGFSDALEESRIAKENLNSQTQVLEAELKDFRNREGKLKEEKYNLGLKQERFRVEAEQAAQRLQEEYHMVLAEALPYRREDLTKKDKRSRIKVLKEQINALGNVNLGAIEEYKTVSQRYDFLTQQRNDVLAAKASLEEVVSRMDEIITKRFLETFQEINQSFQETFPAFFRGGYGELRLTDPENLLETGVEVVVQPPGKRLQHHSLLSGGELALSGIALVFAILKVRSSPFYVLDEIDAALDDVNVSKFGSYLQEYGKNSQFLVITHRQGTMEAAGELYGITMAEEGVSRTVSVRLEEAIKE